MLCYARLQVWQDQIECGKVYLAELGPPVDCYGETSDDNTSAKSQVIAGKRPVVVLARGSYVPVRDSATGTSRMLLVVPGTTSTGRAQVEPTLEVDARGRSDVFLPLQTVFLPQQFHVMDMCCIVQDAHTWPVSYGNLTSAELYQLRQMIASWVQPKPQC